MTETLDMICLITAIVSVTGRGGGGDNIQYTDLSATVTHNEKTAMIVCPYPDSHVNNTKFLCKGESPLNCEELVQTPEVGTYELKGRFSIRDNQRLKRFTVHIKRLGTADVGTYWCGSERQCPHASCTKVHLVNDGRIQTKRSGPKQTTAAPSSTAAHHGRIGVSVACLALLVIAGMVLIVFICKLCRTQGGSAMPSTVAEQNSEENHKDTLYEEIKEQSQGLSSADPTLSIHASVNPSADQLHYVSVGVSVKEDAAKVSTDGNPHPDSDENVSSACEYSLVRMTQGGPGPSSLYSTVQNPGDLCV